MKEQKRAKQLCWEYNRTAPDEQKKRKEILQKLLGTCDPMTGIEPDFHCDYGFNIHTHGLVVINYNCVILDTSPVHIGGGIFIAPGVCLACAGHAIDPVQRSQGIGTSAPITIEENVWIGANIAGMCYGRGSGKCNSQGRWLESNPDSGRFGFFFDWNTGKNCRDSGGEWDFDFRSFDL